VSLGRRQAQRLFLARVNAALRAVSRRLRVVAALRPAARRFRVNAAFWPGVSVALGLVFMNGFPFFLSGQKKPDRCVRPLALPQRVEEWGAESGTMLDELHIARSTRLHGEVTRSKCATHSRRLLELYLARLPFCRGKLHLAQETQHERQARPRRPTRP